MSTSKRIYHIMVLRPPIAAFVFFVIFISAGILYLGKGQEEGDSLAKDIQSFFSYEIESHGFSIISRQAIEANAVPLPFSKLIKHAAKRLLITMGLAMDRKSYAFEFALQQERGAHLACLVRIHGDQVLAIVIRSTPKDHGSAMRLKTLLQPAFPGYDIPILETRNPH